MLGRLRLASRAERAGVLGLLLLGFGAHFAPEHLAAAGVGSVAALEYIGTGIESAVAWAIVAWLCWRHPLAVVALWLCFEAAQRPVCRLAFPLHQPPALRGQTLCTAALGADVSAWLGLTAAALCIAYVWRALRHDPAA